MELPQQLLFNETYRGVIQNGVLHIPSALVSLLMKRNKETPYLNQGFSKDKEFVSLGYDMHMRPLIPSDGLILLDNFCIDRALKTLEEVGYNICNEQYRHFERALMKTIPSKLELDIDEHSSRVKIPSLFSNARKKNQQVTLRPSEKKLLLFVDAA